MTSATICREMFTAGFGGNICLKDGPWQKTFQMGHFCSVGLHVVVHVASFKILLSCPLFALFFCNSFLRLFPFLFGQSRRNRGSGVFATPFQVCLEVCGGWEEREGKVNVFIGWNRRETERKCAETAESNFMTDTSIRSFIIISAIVKSVCSFKKNNTVYVEYF